MSEPILEQIAATVVQRLGEITKANGFQFDAESVVRVNRDATDWTPRHLSILVVQGEEVENPELSHPGNPPGIAYDVGFNIHGFVRHSDRETVTSAITENQMIASIKKSITNSHDWHNFGGLAIDAQWNDKPFESNENDHEGATVGIVITYRISERDPYVVRV